MFSTPRRKIHVYSGKENKTPRALKSIGKETNAVTRTRDCRTPLSDVNRKRCFHNQRKETKDDTTVCKAEKNDQQRCSVRNGRLQTSKTEEKPFSDRGGLLTDDVDSHQDGKKITQLTDVLLRPPSSFKETVALLSATISPLHEDSSSVISLTSLDSESPSPEEEDEEAEISLRAEDLVCEAIRNAKSQVIKEINDCPEGSINNRQAQEECLATPLQEFTYSTDYLTADTFLSENGEETLSPCEAGFSDVVLDGETWNCGRSSEETDRTDSSEGSEESFECDSSSLPEESRKGNNEMEFLNLTDSGLSVNLYEDNETTDDISLDKFLIFQSQPVCEERDKSHRNLFLSVTPSKVMLSAPQLLPVPEMEISNPNSEYEIAKSAGNLWNAQASFQLVDYCTIASPLLRSEISVEGVNDDSTVSIEIGKGRDMAETDSIGRVSATPKIAVGVNRDCGTSPVLQSNRSSMTTPVQTLHQQTEVTPKIHSDQSCNTTPVHVTHTSTVMTPCELMSQSCNTSPVTMVSVETATEQQCTHDIGVGESVATTSEMATQRTPSHVQDKGCGTSPPAVQNSCQMTSPIPSEDAETSMTPISVSPVRLTGFSRKSENSLALMEQMKTSHISNKLLRREVSALKRSKTKWEEHLQKEQLEMKQKMSMMHREKAVILETEQTAKVAAQGEIDELLAQVGQLLNQMGDLESKLRQKDEDIGNLQRLNDERKRKYCDEIKELQDDLCMTYKQHEVEVSELTEKFEQQACYERLYQKAMEKNKLLEGGLESFSKLEDSLQRAAKLQEKMPVVQEAFSLVKSLFEQTLIDKAKLTQKTKELDDRTERFDQDNEARLTEHQRLVEENEELTLRIEEEEKKVLFAEAERERIQEQLQETEEANAKLETEAKNSLGEIESFKLEKETLEKNFEDLQNAEQLAAADRRDDQERLSSRISDLETKNNEMSETMEKLNEDNGRLIGEVEPLKLKLQEATQCIEDMKENLKKSEDAKEFLNQERESLEEYMMELEEKLKTMTNELTGCKRVLQEERRTSLLTIHNAQEHLRSSQSELEHTRQRAHQIIIQQGAQISSASTALADLVVKLDQYNSEEMVTAGEGVIPQREDQQTHSSSFVFSILNSPRSRGDQTTTSKDSSFRVGIKSSASSASKVARSSGGSRSSPEFEETSGLGRSCDSAFSLVTPAKIRPPSGRMEVDKSVAELVQQVNDHFNLLMERVLNRLECSRQTIQEQEFKSKQLISDLQKTKKQHSSQLGEVQEALRMSENQIRLLKQELRSTNSRTCDDKERLQEALHMMEMGGHERSHQQRMQKEVDRLSVELHRVEGERGLYQDQLATLSSLMSSKGDSIPTMALLAKMSTENTQMKREMRVLEENWQKAEAEVKSLDSLFDQCVKMLEKVPQPIKDKDNNLKTLSRILLAP
ncbi:uncharacterized protein [Apostichopus japonicus]|uniref:uncharacterized protein isoform X1 n=1 Tax=Stichopus japonicus TaxID=307972 RepID=UPI003AB7F105